MKKCLSFLPVIDNNSKVLILGSMPGIKSLEAQQYYAYSRNRFWKLMGVFCNCSNMHNLSYDEKIKIVLENNFAIWDVLGFCERDGSLDSSIENEVPNDISKLLEKYNNIEKIVLNGNKAYAVFKKYFPELLENYSCYKMPSTSPANAKYRLEDLYVKWSKGLN